MLGDRRSNSLFAPAEAKPEQAEVRRDLLQWIEGVMARQAVNPLAEEG